MTFEPLMDFITVTEAGNITKAAKILMIHYFNVLLFHIAVVAVVLVVSAIVIVALFNILPL